MTNPVLPSGKLAPDEVVLIDIYKNLPSNEQDYGLVSVCPVPKFLRSAKSEAFTPHFVGLSPYHHYDPNLPITYEMKLGVVKNSLPFVRDISDAFQSLQNQDVVLTVEVFYYSTCDYHTLQSVLTVDGLFLLALLFNCSDFWSFFGCFASTGELYPKLPVNAAGIELSMDGIIRDLFMLENQIPTKVMEHIIQVSDINIMFQGSGLSTGEFLNSMMLRHLCIPNSPFSLSYENLSENPKSRDHLLDLMYYSISPEPQPPEYPQLRHRDFYLWLGIVMCVPIILVFIFCFGLWILLWILAYVVVVTLQPFLKLIRFVLVKVIPWSGAIFGQPKIEFPTLRHFIGTVRDLWVYYVLNATVFSFSMKYLYILSVLSGFIPLAKVVFDYLYRERLDEFRDSIDSSATVPSASELNNFRIQFKRVESDISAVKFDDKKGEFQLPCIKLDVTSEFILRNLVAYESTIKFRRLNLRSYMQLMSALVQTEKDVKFLVEKKIIQTQLRAEAVIQVFNMPMDRSAKRLMTEEIEGLEVRLKNVKPKVDAINNLYLILTEFLRICAVCSVVVAFFPLVSEGFHKIWCSTIFANSSQSYCNGNQVGDSASRNNNDHMISST